MAFLRATCQRLSLSSRADEYTHSRSFGGILHVGGSQLPINVADGHGII